MEARKKLSEQSKEVIKVIIAGDGGIGKTTLMKKVCFNQYDVHQKLTVGSDFFLRQVRVADNVFHLQVWDFGGQEQFRFFLDSFVGGAQGAILGFEVFRMATYLNLEGWIKLLRSVEPHMPIILVGLKLDLQYASEMGQSQVREFIKKHKLQDYVEVSSKEETNTELPFLRLVQQIKGCSIDEIKFIEECKTS